MSSESPYFEAKHGNLTAAENFAQEKSVIQQKYDKLCKEYNELQENYKELCEDYYEA